MKKIDLSQLTDLDFEEFSKDLLSYKLNKPARTFKRSKDKGIDGIVLDVDGWIMQAKFYQNTSDSTMLSNLKIESEKVKKLKPKRYFLVISKELTITQYKKIIDIFSPYLKPEDLYDAKIIQDIVQEEQASYILDKWDKLWLPSPYFVQKFYEKFKKSKYEYEKSQIIEESKIFVETSIYRNAENMLRNKNVILIHGEPGAGKTTLARRLAVKYIAEGYDFLYEHTNDIKDVETYLYDGKNKVIIIDDFLGQNTFELKEVSDNRLYNIISYARKNKNVKLILTTRTYIYNNSRQLLEKFSETTDRLDKLLIEVKDYTEKDKGKILYNHLYYNGLLWSAEYLEIVKRKYYSEIIYNHNFTPRNIAKICEIIKEDRPNNVIEVIDALLENPEEIWKYEYSKIDKSEYGEYEKILLDLVCLLKYQITEGELKEQFKKTLNNNQDSGEELFYKSMEELSNAFIRSSFNADNEKIYELANPSMGDFLRRKTEKDKNKVKKYIENIDKIGYLWKIYLLLYKDEEMVEFIKKRVENIWQDNYLDYADKECICTILDDNPNKKQKEIIKNVIEQAFSINNVSNSDFILELLENEDDGITYKYGIEYFKKYEIEDPKTRYGIAYMLQDTYDWNNYLGICRRIVKRRNSKHLMGIKEYMIDDLIDIVTDEAEDQMYDSMDYIEDELKMKKDIDQICDEFVKDVLQSMENIYDAYTPETLEYIFGTVIANHEVYLTDEEIEEGIRNFRSVRQVEEIEDDIELEDLFEKTSGNNLIDEYIINNISDEKNAKKILKQKERWYFKEFLDDVENLKIITNFINNYNEVPDNPITLGKEIVKFLSSDNELYEKNALEIALIANAIIKDKENLLDIENEIVLEHKEIIEQLKKDSILKEAEGKIYFLNKFFLLYFLKNQAIHILNNTKGEYDNWDEENGIIELANMHSYKNIENFNNTFIKFGMDKYTKYMRKQDKYAISKFLIDKLRPTIYIRIGGENSSICISDVFFQYIGIDFIGNLMRLKYRDVKKILEEKYKGKGLDRNIINFEKAIRDEETVKAFDEINVWDYFADVYKKLVILSKELEKNPQKDFYMFFDNEKEFGKYLKKQFTF